MQTSGSLSALFRPGLRTDFRDSLESWDPTYTQYLKISTTTEPEHQAAIIAGLNRLVEVFEGEAIPSEDVKMSPVVQGVDREFGMGFRISARAIEDDKYGKANQGAKWLGEAVNLTYEYQSALFVDDMFSGSTFLGYDGLSWLNTAHTCVGNSSVTWSNTPSSPVAFSVTGITQLLDLVGLTKNHNGDPMKWMPDRLMIGNSAGIINRAIQIFKGGSAEPFTANNEENAVKMRLAIKDPIVNPYVASSSKYYMFSSRLNDAMFVHRRKATFESWDTNNPRGFETIVTCRFLIWGVDPRGWVGANPT